MSADNRSRTLPPTRDTSARVEARLSGRLTSVIIEIISCSSSSEVGRLSLAFGNLLCRDSRQLCSRMRHPSSASSARRTREIIGRKIRAMFSARSTYRPSQKTLSATLLGTPRETRRNSTGSLRGCSILNVSTGPSQRTQASLLWPPRCIETTDPSASATRTNPPGIAVHPIAGIEHVGTQHHAARVEASVVPHGRSGQSDLLLCHVLMRAGAQFARQTCPFRLAGVQPRRPAPCRVMETPVLPPRNRDD